MMLKPSARLFVMGRFNDSERATRVILELIRQADGDSIEGKTRLFKAFYFAHLYYALDNSDYLTEWPIVRMPNGPGIDNFDELMAQLVSDKLIEIQPCMTGPYKSSRYVATSLANKQAELSPPEIAAINKAVGYVTGKSCTDLSEITHEHSKTWNDGKNGEELPIYLDLLSDSDYKAAKDTVDQAGQALHDAWS